MTTFGRARSQQLRQPNYSVREPAFVFVADRYSARTLNEEGLLFLIAPFTDAQQVLRSPPVEYSRWDYPTPGFSALALCESQLPLPMAAISAVAVTGPIPGNRRQSLAGFTFAGAAG